MAEAVRREAGWERPVKEKDEAAEFSLDGGLAFSLIRRGERLAAFVADLGAWPEDEMEADELAKILGRMAAGAFSKRLSVVSAASGRYGLHLPFDPSSLGLEEIPKLCAAFLNDLDWWRQNLSRS
jgi:hypothetical protein